MESPASRRIASWSAATRERLRFGLYASHLLTLFGIALSNIALGLALLAFPVLRDPAEDHFRRARPLLAALLAYAGLLLVAVVFSQDPAASVDALRELFTLAALPLAIASIRGERRLRSLFDAAILGAMLAALTGLAQFWIGFGDLDRRIRGPFSHVMTFSGILLLVDLLLVARLIFRPAAVTESERGISRFLGQPWLGWLALVAINVALVGSLTRNAWLGLLVAGGWLLWMRRRRLVLWALPAAVAFVVLAPVPVLARAISIVDLSDESSYDRLCMLEAGARMVAEHPLFGIGPNMVERLYPIYRHVSASRLNVPHLHDSYAQLAAERGLPALASYLALLAVALTRAWRGYHSELGAAPKPGGAAGGGSSRADLWLGVSAALLAFSVSGLFEHNWGDVEVQRIALLLLAAPFCLDIASPAEPERDA